ncbi:MAG: hypothetical protein DRP87_17485 [Spirochaetes bacterium]|nr:MAG: hypothetical protein DRP87_17485 [Spirochaetota bacterium]
MSHPEQSLQGRYKRSLLYLLKWVVLAVFSGITGPAVIVGMLFGAAAADFLDIPLFSADYFAFVSAGFSALLAGTMNIPLASAIIAVESFGLQYGFPAGVASIIGFQINRFHTVYEYSIGTGSGSL